MEVSNSSLERGEKPTIAMYAMQAVATGNSAALPSLLRSRSAPRAKLGVVGIRSLQTEFQSARVECAARRAEARLKVERVEEVGEAERSDVGVASGAFTLCSVAPLMVLADANTGYSQASYNTTLGLFLLSLPGVWSLVKRATKSKVGDDVFLFCAPVTIFESLFPLSLWASFSQFNS